MSTGQRRFTKGGLAPIQVGELKQPYLKKDGSPGQPFISADLVKREMQRLADRQVMLFNRFGEMVGFSLQASVESFAATAGVWTEKKMSDLWSGAPNTASGVILDVELIGAGSYISFSDVETPDAGKILRLVGVHASYPNSKTFILPLNEEAHKRIWYASTATATVKLVGWLTMPTEE
jgi:hypothetical protein